MRRRAAAEAAFDSHEHHIANHFAADAGRRRRPSDSFPIACIEGDVSGLPKLTHPDR